MIAPIGQLQTREDIIHALEEVAQVAKNPDMSPDDVLKAISMVRRPLTKDQMAIAVTDAVSAAIIGGVASTTISEAVAKGFGPKKPEDLLSDVSRAIKAARESKIPPEKIREAADSGYGLITDGNPFRRSTGGAGWGNSGPAGGR